MRNYKYCLKTLILGKASRLAVFPNPKLEKGKSALKKGNGLKGPKVLVRTKKKKKKKNGVFRQGAK
jgi:hypothetical protein